MNDNTMNGDGPHVVRAGNITVASGWKCRFCGLLRPWDRIECPKCPQLGWADRRLRDANEIKVTP